MTNRRQQTSTAARVQPIHPLLICFVAWLVPGAGQLWQGRWQKGVVFLVMLPVMFTVGLMLNGRLFPFDPGTAARLPRRARDARQWSSVSHREDARSGPGLVTAASYEYGNTFVIVSGLLNMLVVIDAYDIALGRK